MFRSISRSMSTTFQILGCEVTKSAVNGPVENKIIGKLLSLNPHRIVVRNDSHKHSHHRSMQDADNTVESHFNIEVVSDEFKGVNQPNRHRIIYKLLDDEIKVDKVHALQLKTKTLKESGVDLVPSTGEAGCGCGHSHSHSHGNAHDGHDGHSHTH